MIGYPLGRNNSVFSVWHQYTKKKYVTKAEKPYFSYLWENHFHIFYYLNLNSLTHMLITTLVYARTTLIPTDVDN